MVSFVTNAFPATMKGKVARLPPDQKVLKYQSVPPVQPAYKKFMGAVDRLGQRRKTYGFDKKSKRYWVRPSMNLFDIAVNNAHCLYKHNCRAHGVEHVNLFDFRQGLSKMLMKKSRCVRKQRAHGYCREQWCLHCS